MNILFVAVFNPKSTNVSQALGFERAGHEVIRYDYRAPRNKKSKNRDIPRICREESVDLVVISKGHTIDAMVLKECNKMGATTCVWYMDPKNKNWDRQMQDRVREALLPVVL